MDNPEVSEEERKELVEVIAKRAEAYTGDWRFYPDHPDMGTVLALLYADMMQETISSYKNLLKKYQLYLYDLLGQDCLPATEAKGYAMFATVNGEVPGTWVPAGTKLFGDTQENPVTFETQDEIYVCPAQMEKVYYVNGNADYISQPFTFPVSGTELFNRQAHIVYIGHPFLLSMFQKGEVIIDFHIQSKEEDRKLEELLLHRVTWSYYSTDGYVEVPSVRYLEGQIFLAKDTMMPAFEKKEIQGKYTYWIRMEIQKIRPQQQILFHGISMAARADFLEPEIIYDGNTELDRESFYPFGEEPYPYAEVYFSNDEVFSKRGAMVKLQFDLEYVKHPNGFKMPDLPVKRKNIVHKSEWKRPEPCDIRIESVIWEYYNGNGWTRLADTKGYQNMFMEERKSGEVLFRCPDDIQPFLLAGKERYCIRIRVLKVGGLHEMEGIYVVPCIKNLFFHYCYEKVELSPHYAYAVNQLETRTLSCKGESIPFYNLFPDKEMLYLSFSNPLKEEGIRFLFVMKRQNGKRKYRFEYYGEDGFQALKVEDETFHLSRTGLLTLCEEHSFAKHCFFGTDGYWIRIVWEQDGEEGFHLPPIKDVYLNAVGVIAQKESGRLGNLSAGALHTMEKRIGYIHKVTNYEAITGGCDTEKTEQAAGRIAACFRHRNRAVTPKDFEDIVSGSMRNILKIRCFPGRDESGNKAPGHVTLVVLLEKEEQMYFDSVKEDIYECLAPYMDWGLYREGRLHIVEPEWYFVRVYMKVVAKEKVKQHQLKEKIYRQIQAFIHPVTGNFDGAGWKIGTVPSAIQIQNVCNQMEEISYIRHISLEEEYPAGIYALGISDRHEIEIIAE